ncbi:MAG: hypothetical protein QOI62_1235 [Solirubrobacteraceae bacterium]|nr:hypothetical protein [Solirubrobacteraceae bacterium]
MRRTSSPHEFYRYPARFAPELAKAAIEAFSAPGDLVADYFVGGGTTLVEARRAGRLGVGTDINSLSIFVSTVKTRLYSEPDLASVKRWAGDPDLAHGPVDESLSDEALAHYFRNVGDDIEEQRTLLVGAVAALNEIDSPRARDLARCVLLRTAQWGLDMRREVPSEPEFRAALVDNAARMADTARASTRMYRQADRRVSAHGLTRTVVLEQALPGVAGHRQFRAHPAPRLVLTSPPYPGVYVNYHRWKVRGRKETPFPYYLAGQQDGNGLAYYTMHARSDRSLDTYFDRLRAAFQDIAHMCDDDTHVVQVVGFNNVSDQLTRYLDAMAAVGLREVKYEGLATAPDGRLWRDVPGRRWWARAGERSDLVTHTAQEVVLVHKKA